MRNITTYINAGFSALYLVSVEEHRVELELKAVATKLNYEFWTWNCVEGLMKSGKQIPETLDPAKALLAFTDSGKIPKKSIVVFKDMHMFLKQCNPLIVRRVKDAIVDGRKNKRHIIILGCQLHLPPELEKEITVIEYSLPSREELGGVAAAIGKSAKIEIKPEDKEKIIDAGSGLTTNEFADALAYSIVDKKKFDPPTIYNIKSDTIKKNGILEIVSNQVTLDEIGGLDLLKEDLFTKRNSFSQEAKDYGLPTPRPLLAVGQAGTGKSLTATATGTIFGIPLLRLEAGRLFGSLVGESERNWRTAFSTAKAISPCVVWVDEVDGLFAGAESSGKTDGGTTSRVIKAILQDLQFNSDGMFFVFTANDIDALPDPLIDRCEVWSVELPNIEERKAIWNIHIAKRKRDPKKFNVKEFASQSEGFSGRQIEQAWIKAMTRAFNDKVREPSNKDVIGVLKEFVPTSVTMKEAIENRRNRLKDRARPASSVVEKEEEESEERQINV